MKKDIIDDQINLLEIFENIWKNKFLIVSIALIAVLIAYGLTKFQKTKYFLNIEIVPIDSYEESFYLQYNSYINNLYLNQIQNFDQSRININKNQREDILSLFSIKKDNENLFEEKEVETKLPNNFLKFQFNTIDKNYLRKLYITKFKNTDKLFKFINESNLVNKDDLNNDENYIRMIKNVISKLKLLPPEITNKKIETPRINWEINIESTELKKWEDIIVYIDKKINNEIQTELKEIFQNKKNNSEKILKFNLENINSEIINLKNNYKLNQKKRLAYLDEQAKLARQLDIENSTNYQDLNNQDTLFLQGQVLRVKDKSYYMKGYRLIEKEIELIKSRTDISPFVNGLYELEFKKEDLLSNKDLSRIQKLFVDTPIITSENFKSSNLIFNYKEQSPNLFLNIISSLVAGLIFGIFIALILEARERKFKKK